MSQLRIFVEHPDDAPWEPSVIHCGEFSIREARDGALLIEDGMEAAVRRMMVAAQDEGDDGWYRMLLRAAVGEGDR